MTGKAKTSPHYRPRRAGDLKAAERRKRKIVATFDPLAGTIGVSSRHYRQRVADDRAAEAVSAAVALAARPPPPPVLWHPGDILPGLDSATSALRRRVLEAIDIKPPSRLPRIAGWSLVVGLSILLWLVFGAVVFALEQMASAVS